MMKGIFTLFLSVLLMIINIEAKEQEKLPYPRVYPFFQQDVSLCHISPFINYEILQQARADNFGIVDFEKMKKLPRWKWQFIEYNKITAWFNAMNRLLENKEGAFRNWYQYWLSYPLIQTFRPKANIIRSLYQFFLQPFNFVEIDKSRLRTFAPVIWIDNKWLTYDVNQDAFRSVEYNEYPKEFVRAYGFNIGSHLLISKTLLNEQKSDKILQPYEAGLYQLILLRLGIDKENKEIKEGHLLYDVWKELDAEMKKDPSNPWAKIDKNLFFEYRLAQLFDQNPILKEKVKKIVDAFVGGYDFYKEMPNEAKRMLPGDTLMLASLFSLKLRLLWASSVSQQSLNGITDLRPSLVESLGKKMMQSFEIMQKHLGFLPMSSKGFKNKAYKKVHDAKLGTFSFVDVWNEIKNTFMNTDKQGTKNIQYDYISFSTHGCIISFDPDLIDQTYDYHDVQLKNDLGITVIDSTYANDMNPKFMIEGTEDDMIQAALRKAMK